MRLADSFARASAGRSMLARIAMIAITTSSSMSVNAISLRECVLLFRFKKNGAFNVAFMHFISSFTLVRIFQRVSRQPIYLYDEKAMDADCTCGRARRLLALPE